MVSTDGPVPEQAYVNFLVQQMHASLDFLVAQHQVSRPDANLIKSKLPVVSPPVTSVTSEFTQLSMTPTSEASRNVGPPDATAQSTIFTPPPPAVAQAQSPSQPQPSQQQLAQSPGRVVPPPPARPPVPPQARAKALWAYNGGAPDDLTFSKGDVIIILAEENTDWWRGEVVGREGIPGLFPSNHVERLPSEPASPAREHNTPQSYAQAHQPHYVPPPPPQTWQQQPYGQPPAAYYGQDQKAAYQQPAPPPEPQTVVVEGKKKPFSGRLGQAFVGGVGFGAGSAVASNVVNSIL